MRGWPPLPSLSLSLSGQESWGILFPSGKLSRREGGHYSPPLLSLLGVRGEIISHGKMSWGEGPHYSPPLPSLAPLVRDPVGRLFPTGNCPGERVSSTPHPFSRSLVRGPVGRSFPTGNILARCSPESSLLFPHTESLERPQPRSALQWHQLVTWH